MHDNPQIWPTLPSREITAEDARLMLDPVRGTEWQTCWEYRLSHNLTEAEGAAFWTGARLAMDAAHAGGQIAQAAYERGWRDACDDHLDQVKDPDHPIGERHQQPYDPEKPKIPRKSA